MTRAQEAYDKIMEEVYKFDSNPTYELCGITIENLVGKHARVEMMLEGLIKYIGTNHNGLSVYKIR